jgi:hypothetical protein
MKNNIELYSGVSELSNKYNRNIFILMEWISMIYATFVVVFVVVAANFICICEFNNRMSWPKKRET